jgi:hypothetical protein
MSESLQQTKTRLETFIGEAFPSADISPGSVLNELLIKLAATIQNPIKNDIDDLIQTNTVIKALDSTVDTFNPVIDGLASNYSVVRNEGSKSVGKLKITVTSEDTIFIDEGFSFTQPILKLNYLVPSSYRITTNPREARDIKLTKVSKNSTLYFFILPVVAENVGGQYQLYDKISVNLTTPNSLTGFVDAKAYGSFSSGLALETDKELITRFKLGLSQKTLLTKDSIQAKVSDLYPNLQDVSVVTTSDPEMFRNKQNILGISTLGTADVYLRTSVGLETLSIQKTAIKISDTTWSMSFDYKEAAGFYRIISILPENSGLTGTLEFETVFNYDNSIFKDTNLLNNKYEARFTKYQTAEVTFTFDESVYDLPIKGIGEEGLFSVLVTYQPNIADIQDLFLTNRILCADYLVKAMLPCFVSIDLKLERNNSFGSFPTDLLKQDIYKYINGLKIGEDLQASKIVDLCHNYDVKRVKLPIKLSGEIFTNKDTIININSKDVLSIPSNYSLGVSKKTTGFIVNYFNSGVDPEVNITDAISITVL